jgi:replicative DNA helicase Mcm
LTTLVNPETSRPEDVFQDFFRSYLADHVGSKYRKRLAQVAVNNGRSLVIDFEELIAFDPALARSVTERPDDYIGYASSAATAQMRVEDPEYAEHAGRIFARFRRLPEKRALRKIGAEDMKKLALVEGIVVRTTQVRPMIVKAVFRCRKCLEIVQEEQSGDLMRGPGPTCPICKQKTAWELLEEQCKFKNTQEARVQERPEDLPPGQLPRYLDVRLEDDLVDTARPGDRVAVTSIVRAEKQYVGEKGRLRTFNLYLEANFVDIVGKETEVVEITREDEKKILEISKDPFVHRKLIMSLAPSIYGYGEIKEGILYLLFGGVSKHLPDGVSIRGDLNTLLIGDPGTAKSQLLQYVSRIAPRGLYTSGRGTTAAGLTAAVLREKTGGMVLEAGALVLADKGIACLHPDSEVFVDGAQRRVAELFDEGRVERARSGGNELELSSLVRPVANLDLDKLTTRNATATLVARRWYSGEVLRICMDSGMELRLTPAHPVLDGETLEWKPIGDFGPGDKIVALKKLPASHAPVLILDVLPDDWIIQPTAREKMEIRQALGSKHHSLRAINSYYGLKRDALNGRGGLTVGQFRAILKDTGLYSSWAQRPFAYGRKKRTENLKIAAFTPELGYILGFAYGDGYVQTNAKHSSLRITQSSVHADYIRRLHEAMGHVSHRPWKVYLRKAVTTGFAKSSECQDLVRHSSVLVFLFEWLTRNGLQNLLHLNDRALAGFFAGAVDADGCFSVKKNGHYSSVSFDLLLSNNLVSNRRLLWALRRFDVYARIRKLRGVMNVQITSNSDIRQLIERISPYSGKAKDIPRPRIRSSARHEKVPATPLRAALSGLRPVPSELLLSGDWSTFHSYRNGKRQPYKAPLQRLTRALDPWLDASSRERLLALSGSDYALEAIRTIKSEFYAGYVYDLRVPLGEHFVTEGVLTHNCIDELDKMRPDDRVAIHEALEQQTVSVAKGGIVATLNARASVLAAANPALGRYEPHKNINENINLPVTILSRFDLIFLVKDLPEPENDTRMSDHILSLHKTRHTPEEAPFPPDFLRKYISYAKRIVPVLTAEAVKELQDFYLKMRNTTGKEAAVAITPRQLEGLVRISEARARSFLRDEVTVEDAKSAVKIMSYALYDVGVDVKTGKIDIDTIMTGKPATVRDSLGRVMAIVAELERETGTVDEKILTAAIVEREKVTDGEARRFVGQLIKEGMIYSPKEGKLKRTSG